MSAPSFEWKQLGEKGYRSILNSTARINIWHGAVRAGKTIDSIARWIEFVSSNEVPGELLMTGKTERTLKRNILDPIASMVGDKNFRVVSGSGEAYLCGRRIYLAGASDERAEGKIRGMTLAGAYGDEITLWPEAFFKMLLSRLSIADAKLFGTTNPGPPTHWLYNDYIKNKDLDLRHWQYQLDDNPNLSREYVENLKREYSGVWYRRFILGEWCIADGLVYPMIDHDWHVIEEADIPKITHVNFAVDVGHSNATVFLAIGEGIDRRAYVLDEYYHSGRETGTTKSPIAYAKDFIKWHETVLEQFRVKFFDAIYIDPSALGFKAQLRELGLDYTYDANNDVVKGIQTVASVIDNDLLRINKKCKRTIDESKTYAWDEKASLIGEDKPIKSNDHAMDCIRYFFHSTRSQWIGRKPRDGVKRLA